MACFIVPLTQAVATTVVRRHNTPKEQKQSAKGSRWLRYLPRLEAMLWGGSAMLVLDHIISGEVMAKFPFFSALLQEGGVWVMLKEMLTVGLPMSVLVTALWAVSVVIQSRSENAGTVC